MTLILNLLVLALVGFVQNMAFTWSSRSRNSGDYRYHRYAAWTSNGVWFLTQLFLFRSAWDYLLNGGSWFLVGVTGLVYTIATTEGSVFMMWWLLKSNFEKGARGIGAK